MVWELSLKASGDSTKGTAMSQTIFSLRTLTALLSFSLLFWVADISAEAHKTTKTTEEAKCNHETMCKHHKCSADCNTQKCSAGKCSHEGGSHGHCHHSCCSNHHGSCCHHSCCGSSHHHHCCCSNHHCCGHLHNHRCASNCERYQEELPS